MPENQFLINETHTHKYRYMNIHAGRYIPHELYIDPSLLFRVLRE